MATENLGMFDLSVPGNMVLPKTMICKECGVQTQYSPSTIINYANRQVVVSGLCDECISKKIAEGRQKLGELRRNIEKAEKSGRINVKAAVEKEIEGKNDK